jgi:hypothetical protein
MQQHPHSTRRRCAFLLRLSKSSVAAATQAEEEVFEYERYLPLRGWSGDHLRGFDPHHYSRQRNGARGSDTFPRVALPEVCGSCLSTCPACTMSGCMHAYGELVMSVYPTLPCHSMPLQGWEWEGPWEVELSSCVDPEGWAYALEPSQFRWPPQPTAGIKKAHDFVRRCGSHTTMCCVCRSDSATCQSLVLTT